LRRIQQATGIRRETAGAYLKAAGIPVRRPSGWGRRAPKPANEVITDSGTAKPAIPVIPDCLNPNLNPNPNPENLSNKGRSRTTAKPANENAVITDSAVVTGSSACELYREAIDLGLSRGRNARAIWQDLVCEYGFASSYQSVQRFVRKRRGTQTPEARVVIVIAAGQEAQVDYGTGPMVRDPESRKYRRTRLFVLTLGCSRKSVRLLTRRSRELISLAVNVSSDSSLSSLGFLSSAPTRHTGDVVGSVRGLGFVVLLHLQWSATSSRRSCL